MIESTLICRYVSNGCTKKEKSKIKEWIRENSNNRDLINDYRKIIEISKTYYNNSEDIQVVDVMGAWTKFKDALSNVEYKKSTILAEDKGFEDFPTRIKEFLNKQ